MNLENKLKILFYNRAPNTLIFEHIEFEFPTEKAKTLQEILNKLVKEKFLEIIKYKKNDRVPNLERIGYVISQEHIGKYPISTEIDIGTIKIPRLLDGDAARAEDVNVIALSFNKVVDEKIKALKDTYNKELKRIWSTLITIFGIFLAIFSLVNVALKPIYFASELKLSTKELIIQNLYNIAPLSLVLLLFLLLLYIIMRK